MVREVDRLSRRLSLAIAGAANPWAFRGSTSTGLTMSELGVNLPPNPLTPASLSALIKPQEVGTSTSHALLPTYTLAMVANRTMHETIGSQVERLKRELDLQRIQ
jgi:hypothetical protein